MKIVEQYSHLNGLEFLLVHKPELWKEIKDVIHDSAETFALSSEFSLGVECDGKPPHSKVAFPPIFKSLAYSPFKVPTIPVFFLRLIRPIRPIRRRNQ